MLSLIVCLKLWGHTWMGKQIVALRDNQVSVTILNLGRTRDPFLLSCLRELCLIAAIWEFEVRAKHIPGVDNSRPAFRCSVLVLDFVFLFPYGS